MITYKNITDVEALNEMPDGAKVMINDSGELKQTALDLKALDYNNLTKVEAIEELPENAKVLVNDSGELKQVVCSGFGSSGSVCVAIDSDQNLAVYDPDTQSTGAVVTTNEFETWFRSGSPIIYYNKDVSYIIGYYLSYPNIGFSYADGSGHLSSAYPYINFETEL